MSDKPPPLPSNVDGKCNRSGGQDEGQERSSALEGVGAAEMEVRGDAKNLVLISSRLVVRELSQLHTTLFIAMLRCML